MGHITSGAYGHTLDAAVGLGYVETEAGTPGEALLAGHYEIEVACERFAATASLRPLYDPENSRIRS